MLKGKMSTFGGPKDFGMKAAEGLALVNAANLNKVIDYFLPEQPPGTTGIGRRLNPDTFYIACRWEYEKTSHEQLIDMMVTVRNPKTGTSEQAKPVDWGPNVNTHRIADLSPGLAAALGLETDDECEVDY